MLCHVSLCDSVSASDRSFLIRRPSLRKRSSKKELNSVVSTMFGQQTVCGIVLPVLDEKLKVEENGEPELQKLAMFFVFSDLSVRIQGDYRLAVKLVDPNRYFSFSCLGILFLLTQVLLMKLYHFIHLSLPYTLLKSFLV